jgi:predicted metal-dependent hydrolase
MTISAGSARIEIRRSARRRRTVSARCEGDTIVVLMPSGLSHETEQRLVRDVVGKLERAQQRQVRGGDAQLMDRAARLSAQFLGGRAAPASVRWVPPMRSRWASCTPGDGTIRVSELLRDVPAYVLDYILVHELAHLIVPGGHTPQFWSVVNSYPRTERAIGYLEAYSLVVEAAGRGGQENCGEPLADEQAG